MKDDRVSFPKTKFHLNIGKLAHMEGKFQQFRIIPKQDSYVVEVVYQIGEKHEIPPKKDRCMSIDLGLENIATVVTNTGIVPLLFKGGKIKSVNRWYNKLRCYYYAALRNGRNPNEGSFYSKKLKRLDFKRNNQIKDLFHKISFNIVKLAKEQKIDTIVIGKNTGWKQNLELGKRNNQNFVQIPHAMLINQVIYKAIAEGIAVIVNEESYTSKASFLDEDAIPTYKSGNETKYTFSGKRVSRGRFLSKNNILFNADVNGAANILRKVVPLAFANGIAALCSKPHVVNVR